LSRYGVIGYGNASGIGNLIYSFKEMLFPEMTQLVVSHPVKDVVKYYYPCKGDEFINLKNLDVDIFEKWVESTGIKLVLLIEYPYNWEFLPRLRRMGVKVVMIPMLDCFPLYAYKCIDHIDFWIAPTDVAFNYLKEQFDNVCKLPPPINVDRFSFKKRGFGTGVFLHNGGYGGGGSRKSTRLVCEAFKEVVKIYKSSRLLVNLQTNLNCGKLCDRIELKVRNVKNPESLYEEGDVFVYPSRKEGIGLEIFEAMSEGFVVITTNHPPMNEMISCKKFLVNVALKAKNYPLHGMVSPNLQDLVEKMKYTVGKNLVSSSERNREYIEKLCSYDVLRPLYIEVFEEIIKNR